MKVRAKCTIKHKGNHYHVGDVFEVENIDGLQNYVDVLDKPVARVTEDVKTAPKQRGGRKPKTTNKE